MANAILNDGQGPFMTRDPRSRLPVSVDWSAWLAQEGTTIVNSVWSSDDGIVCDTPSFTPQVATVFVSGGVTGSIYSMRNTITTASGIVDSRSLRVAVKDR